MFSLGFRVSMKYCGHEEWSKKVRSPVKKHMEAFNKPKTEVDRKKEYRYYISKQQMLLDIDEAQAETEEMENDAI